MMTHGAEEKLQQQKGGILALKLQLKECDTKTAKMKVDHVKELEEQHVTIMKEMMTEGGLTRRNLVSEEYQNIHKRWLSKYLYSRPYRTSVQT